MASRPSDKLVTVFGGSGFIGRQIVRSLAKRGYRIRVACRRPDLAGHVLPLGTPGQIALVQANLRYPASVAAACDGAYAVVNATGTDVSSGAQSFDAVIVFGSEAVAKAAKQAKAELMVMVSGMGASVEAASEAGRPRAKAEAATCQAPSRAAMVRHHPSCLDPMTVSSTAWPAWPASRRFFRWSVQTTKVQPVFVGDVAEAVATLIDRWRGRRARPMNWAARPWPRCKTLMQYVARCDPAQAPVAAAAMAAAKLLGTLVGWLPGAPITADQVECCGSTMW